MPGNPKLIDKLSTRLPACGKRLVAAAADRAAHSGINAFAVGGTARDLLLNRDSLDVDIAVEGDAVGLARDIATATSAHVVKTTSFGTATLYTEPPPFSMDLATAREETYVRPGALPKVRPSTIEADLLRRDFTINAMALELTPPASGKVIDPTGGAADLAAGLIRVLHDRSFQDDATRILRAVRYEVRFGFQLEERTLDLLRRDLAFLDTISGARLRRELKRTFDEPDPAAVLSRMHQLGVLTAVHPALGFTDAQARALRLVSSSRPVSERTRGVFWGIVAWKVPEDALRDVVSRLALTRQHREAVLAIPAAKAIRPRLVDGLLPSEADALFSPLPEMTVLALGLLEDTAASRWARRYDLELRRTRPILRGEDLILLGVPRGPVVGEVITLLRAARLDGEVSSRKDEERLVAQLLRSMNGASVG